MTVPKDYTPDAWNVSVGLGGVATAIEDAQASPAHETPSATSSRDPGWLQRYRGRGFQLVFFSPRTKGPAGKKAEGWTQPNSPASQYQEGANVGALLGWEIKPGRFLHDLDFDWAEGLPLAKRLLPDTDFVFGRGARKVTHAFYTGPTPLVTKQFLDVDGRPIVELRGVKKDGSVGFQSMCPPSIHPSGEELVFRVDGEIAHVEDLERPVRNYAIGAILARHLPREGFGHEARLACAGFLLGAGMANEDVIAIGNAVAAFLGNHNKAGEDMRSCVETTRARSEVKAAVTGAPQLATALGSQGGKVVRRIREWLGGSEFICDKNGEPLKRSQENIATALEKLGITLLFNEFSLKHLVSDSRGIRPLEDRVRVPLRLEIEAKFRFSPPNEYFEDVLYDLGWKNPIHPVKAYLDALAWDGVPRLDTWLVTYGGAKDSDYVRAVGALVLIAAVRRVREPGCKFDELLVLESEQGKFKSSALRTLCPDAAWFSDDLPLGADSKEIIERTSGKWFIEASELHGMSAREVERLKSSLSRQVDGPARLAYARMASEVPRQFVIVGTTNSSHYLKDSTGGRRFWPVRVAKFDIARLAADRDQLWAEAAVREARGESIRLKEELHAAAAEEQEDRREIDPWEDKIAAVIEEYRTPLPDHVLEDMGMKPLEFDPNTIPVGAIWDALGKEVSHQNPRDAARVTRIMQRLGFRKERPRDGQNRRLTAWVRVSEEEQ